jgi:hypothetical protein
MDERRPIDASKVSITGFLICKCGRFTLYLLTTGEFKMIDDKTGAVMGDMTEQDAHDLCDAAKNVELWSDHHQVVKKNG